MIAEAAAAVSAAIWSVLLLARGRFWQVRPQPVPALPEAVLCQRRVVVVIPARDEASVIGATVTSLLRQRYPGAIHVIVVDDQSSDGTADAAWVAAGQCGRTEDLTVLRGCPLAPGWTGKLWALSQGAQAAGPLRPDYLLFTDADIAHGPESVAQLVARAECEQRDLVSYMVLLHCRTGAERALIPAFVFFFFKLYPPAWIADPRARTAGAAGGCILIRPEALARIGGLASLRGALIDDCTLARAVKRGGSIWLGVTADTCSTREYTNWREIGGMVSRTAYTQLDHSPLLLAGTLAGMALTYLAAPVLALTGYRWPHLTGAGVWLLMAGAFLPTLRLYRRSPAWAPALPLIALFYCGATLHSAWAYWQGRGGVWKGRIQDQKRP